MSMPRTMRSSRSRTPYLQNRIPRRSRYRNLLLETLEDRATPAGLIAAYSFDHTSGSTLTDVTGTGHTGTVSGATWIAGKYGNALSFNGSSNMVTIADANDLDLTTAMTLEAWVFPTAVDGWETVLFKGRPSGLAYSLYSGSPGATHPSGYITRVGTTNDIGAHGPAALPLNTWTHLATTYDGTNIRMYVNGDLVATQAAAGTIITSTSAFTIGGNTVWPEWFAGRIDEARIYDRVLTEQEIEIDMVTPLGASSGDVTAPFVTDVAPAMNTRNLPVGSNMTVQFSEAMNASTINSTTIQLRDAAGNLIPANVTYNSITFAATIDPINTLSASASYLTAAVIGGTTGVKDSAGNALAANFTWSFSTGTPQFQETTVFSGLINPSVVEFAPDGRIFVAEKSGLIKVFDNLQDTTATVFADLRTNVYNNWDRGLLGMALSPDFATNPYVYVLYSLDAHTNRTAPVWGTPGADFDPLPNPPGATGNGVVIDGRISRLPVLANGNAGTEQVLLEKQWLQQYPSHSTGTIAFGPDGMLYASAGDGASFVFVDYGQVGVNVDSRNPATMGDPVNEGGSLRSQDLLSPNDPTSLDGTIIRIDPNNAAALSSNPNFATGFDENARRIIAFGLRNPFRFTFRPGTTELWVGDVGWNNWEEINRIIAPTDSLVENFGWPAYEGVGRMDGYDNANLPLLENLYAQEATNPNAHIEPFFAYSHSQQVVPGSGEPTGSSAIAGLAFGQGGNLAGGYDGALFFTDYNRDTIWVMNRGVNGLPDPATRHVFYQSANPLDAVNLKIGPDGSLFFPDFDSGTIRRVRMVGANLPPIANIQASATSGAPPLSVNFSGLGSSDPDGNPLTYSWDLDGDGNFDDSTSATPSFNYTTSGTFNVQLRVTDTGGLSNTASVPILLGNVPLPVIDTPLLGAKFAANSNLTFTGRASDPDEGALGAAALTWTFSFYQAAEEDPNNINLRNRQTFSGVAGGTYVLPDWEYPVFLVIELTATDATGLKTTVSQRVDPQTVDLVFASVPPGLELTINGRTKVTPFTRTTVVGSSNTLGAASPQILNGNRYNFTSWSDGGAISHLFTAPAVVQTYVATFTLSPTPLGLVAAYAFDATSGTTLTDTSGNANHGTTSNGPTWVAGKFGNALSFNGSNQMVTIADSNSLDLTTGMTLEAHVFPLANNDWDTVIMKERPNGLAYALYSGSPGSRTPNGYITRTGTNNDIGAHALTPLPLNAWSHLASTYDGSVIRTYVNGILVGTQAAAGSIMSTGNPLRIGGTAVWPEWFQGRIDEVRIYNRALSAAEIIIDMNTPIASLPVPPGAAMSGLVDEALSSTDNSLLAAPLLLPSTQPRMQRLAMDISGDGKVTPLDALLVINRLNAGGATLRPLEELDLDAGFDASGDGFLTPLDALLVINHLNATSFVAAPVDRPLADDSWQSDDADSLSDEELMLLWDNSQDE